MDFCIRRADKNDAPALAAILTQYWKEAYAHILPTAELDSAADKERYTAVFTSMAQNRANTFLVAYCGGIPCGMLLFCPARDEDLSDYAEIVALYTLQKYWGSGLGRALTEKALDEIQPQRLYGYFKKTPAHGGFTKNSALPPTEKQKQKIFPISRTLCVM